MILYAWPLASGRCDYCYKTKIYVGPLYELGTDVSTDASTDVGAETLSPYRRLARVCLTPACLARLAGWLRTRRADGYALQASPVPVDKAEWAALRAGLQFEVPRPK